MNPYRRPWPADRLAVRARWLAIALFVVVLHALLAWGLSRALQSTPQPMAAQPPLVMVQIRPPSPAPAQATAPTPRPGQDPVRSPDRARREDPATQAVPAAALPPVAEPPAAATAPEAASSAPAGSVLDSEATRRAIRDLARQRSVGELGAQASGEPAAASAQERLGQEIARGARGDCLKGEYAGSGMGLLSLPFWLIAEMREKCRR